MKRRKEYKKPMSHIVKLQHRYQMLSGSPYQVNETSAGLTQMGAEEDL